MIFSQIWGLLAWIIWLIVDRGGVVEKRGHQLSNWRGSQNVRFLDLVFLTNIYKNTKILNPRQSQCCRGQKFCVMRCLCGVRGWKIDAAVTQSHSLSHSRRAYNYAACDGRLSWRRRAWTSPSTCVWCALVKRAALLMRPARTYSSYFYIQRRAALSADVIYAN
jgi:hypothetical protein